MNHASRVTPGSTSPTFYAAVKGFSLVIYLKPVHLRHLLPLVLMLLDPSSRDSLRITAGPTGIATHLSRSILRFFRAGPALTRNFRPRKVSFAPHPEYSADKEFTVMVRNLLSFYLRLSTRLLKGSSISVRPPLTALTELHEELVERSSMSPAGIALHQLFASEASLLRSDVTRQQLHDVLPPSILSRPKARYKLPATPIIDPTDGSL